MKKIPDVTIRDLSVQRVSIRNAVHQFRVPHFQFSDLHAEPRRVLRQMLRIQLLTITNADDDALPFNHCSIQLSILPSLP